MHVLIIPSWYPEHSEDVGGGFFREQALALQTHGCKVGVIYPQLRPLRNWRTIFSGYYGLSQEIDEGMPTYRYHGMNWFPRMQSGFVFLWKVYGMLAYKQYVKDYGHPDIIHVHSTLYAGCLALDIYDAYKIPYIITEHSSAYALKLINKAQMEASKKPVINATFRIAVSAAFANLLDGLYNEKWHYIPNIVSHKFTNFDVDFSGEKENFVFINVAVHKKNKAIDNLLYAFARAFVKYPRVILQLVGDGPERVSLQQTACELGVSDQVFFLGLLKRDEVLEKVAAATSFVFSSRYETFGVAVIEALALGKPVIATRCGGPESIIEVGDGVLVDVDDVDALSIAMFNMFQNYKTYNLQNIRRSAIDRFGEDAVITRLKAIYEEVLFDFGS